MPNVTVGTTVHNIVLVATQHDSLFAFDADTSPCVTLWQANLIDTNHGAGAGETICPIRTIWEPGRRRRREYHA